MPLHLLTTKSNTSTSTHKYENFAMSQSELAFSYAALILADDDVDITVSADHCCDFARR